MPKQTKVDLFGLKIVLFCIALQGLYCQPIIFWKPRVSQLQYNLFSLPSEDGAIGCNTRPVRSRHAGIQSRSAGALFCGVHMMVPSGGQSGKMFTQWDRHTMVPSAGQSRRVNTHIRVGVQCCVRCCVVISNMFDLHLDPGPRLPVNHAGLGAHVHKLWVPRVTELRGLMASQLLEPRASLP